MSVPASTEWKCACMMLAGCCILGSAPVPIATLINDGFIQDSAQEPSTAIARRPLSTICTLFMPRLAKAALRGAT